MGYLNLRECTDDLAATGQLVRIDEVVDARLEAAEIQRRVYASGGPAVFFSNVKGCRFPMVSNLFGTLERARYLFRDTLASVQELVTYKTDPQKLLAQPWKMFGAAWAAFHMLPAGAWFPAVTANETKISQLPQLVSWPDDAGAFITLPAVYSEHVEQPGIMKSNLGMYRVQLSGGRYVPDKQIGLHYQIHRGIGVHHAAALRKNKPFRVNIFVGGSPAVSFSAVMPLPEGLAEVTFAGVLAGHRLPFVFPREGLPIYAEADFCIVGTVDPAITLPEGPFGDHLGYYCRAHDFPVLNVEKVYHRDGAIWPFTVVGRPPQEDTSFGELIHEITGPAIPTVVHGVKAVHAVDAAGVHPLMLAIGSERYVPYEERRRPQEVLTQASAILGQGQMSLAKYLLIVAGEDDPQLEIHDIPAFLRHLLTRIDFTRDVHFQTSTTMDTLDYSGTGLNEGSKVVLAAVGRPIRQLVAEIPSDLRLPEGFSDPRVCLPGVLAIRGPRYEPRGKDPDDAVEQFAAAFTAFDPINRFPLVVAVDDSDFTARTLNNFLWTTFTRSNPAADVHGIESFTYQKHWGCRGSLVIDARAKPHHAPPLVADPEVSKRIDALAARGGVLAKWL